MSAPYGPPAASMFVAEEELQRITHRKRPSAMRRRLDALGIPYRQDAAGRPLVLPAVLEAWAGGPSTTATRLRRPNFQALHERG